MTRLQKVGLGVTAVGVVTAVLNFFKLYGIVGRCSVAGDACADHAYNNWRLHEWLALAVVAVGCVILCTAWYRRMRRKP